MTDRITKVFVTGAGGFLGKWVVSAIQDLRPEVEILAPSRAELDLTNLDAVRAYWSEHHPNQLIHIAAFARGLGGNLAAKELAFIHNEAVIRSPLLAALEFGVNGVVFCGTVAEYGFPYSELPLREEHLLDGPPHMGEKFYGLAKRNADNYLEAIGDRWGATISHALLTNLFGPGDRYDTVSGHVVASMIKKFANAASNNDPVVVLWGVPETTRDFLIVTEAARSLVNMIGKDIGHVNVASGVETSMGELASAIAKATGYRGRIDWDSTMPIGIEKRSIDISKLSTIQESSTFTLADAIAMTVEHEAWIG